MATVNLGRIKPQWQGSWSSATQYVTDDMVAYNNDSWIATTTSTNSAPSDGNSDWDLLARGVSAGSVTATEIADGAVTSAKLADTYLTEIPDGSVTQAKINSSVQLGGVLKTQFHYDNTEHQINAGTWVWWEYPQMTQDFVMTDSSNDLIVRWIVNAQSDNHQGNVLFQYSTNAGSSYTDFPGTNQTGTTSGSVHAELYAAWSYGKITHVREFKITPGAGTVRVRVLLNQDSNAGTIHVNHNNAGTAVGSNGSSSVSFMEVAV